MVKHSPIESTVAGFWKVLHAAPAPRCSGDRLFITEA